MDKLKSRKLWLAIVSALIVIANEGLGLNIPAEAIMTVAGIVITYIIGQSVVDAKSAATTTTMNVVTDQEKKTVAVS